MSAAEILGYRPDARLLIVSADRLGSCHAANVGVFDSLRAGTATTAGLMVPCPWARHAALAYRGGDVGVHLTLNAELETLRWGPITHAPSLLDGDGGFPRTVSDLWDHADLTEVRRELRSQVERAVLWGFEITHLSTHLYALQQRPEFFDVYLDLAVDFGLPIRLQDARSEQVAGFPFRQLAAEEGVLMPDQVVELASADDDAWLAMLTGLEPGITELVLRPAAGTPELEAADPLASRRTADLALLTAANRRTTIADAGVELIGYRGLRTAQRQHAS